METHEWIKSDNPAKIDVPVLILFFARPGCFGQVFAEVKKARPTKLFLYQDGAREGNRKDEEGIAACRAIAADIDWQCEVYRLYQERNFGCDPSEYLAQKWAFSHVDRCIILEDDDVPAQAFFPFCRELLEKYKDDTRINMICGMNNLESVDSPYSYLFTETGSIWGWASWRRVIDTWEGDYAFLTPGYDRDKLFETLKMRGMTPEKSLKVWEANKASGVEHYETINGLSQYTNSRLNIVPTKNMILNVGNTPEGSTHSESGIEMIPRGLRKIYTMKRFEIEFPLKHPRYVIEDIDYQKRLNRLMGTGHPFVQKYRQIEKAFLILRHKGLSGLIKKLR